MADEQDICTVSEFNRYFSNVVADIRQTFFVRGEISEVKDYPSSSYITLKDEFATLKVVLFSSYRSKLSFKPKIGDDVLVQGRGDLYQKNASFTLKAESIRKFGLGEIMERLRLCKEKWRNTYFSKPKRPAPFLVKNLFVVTSAQGAVIRDIIRTRNIRNRGVSIYVIPAAVQGQDCERTVCDGISLANRVVGNCEAGLSVPGINEGGIRYNNSVLIVARGGGSFEDLLPFSSEQVVKAVFESRLVVISSIGHETDEPLCDFAADIRASTPTQAVELCVREISKLKDDALKKESMLMMAVSRLLQRESARLEAGQARLVSAHQQFFALQSHALLMLQASFLRAKDRFCTDANIRLSDSQKSFDNLKQGFTVSQKNTLQLLDYRLTSSISVLFENARTRIEGLEKSLSLLSPISILDRGYCIMIDECGETVTAPESLSAGSEYGLTFKGGKDAAVKISEVRYGSQEQRQ